MEALPYTQQVVNEALRLYPPGWVLSRRTIEADVLGGYPMPAGTNVLLPLYLVHRHPRFWKDPDAFWPGALRSRARSRAAALRLHAVRAPARATA